MVRRAEPPRKDHELQPIRVEANVEELPIFSATKRSRREDVIVWQREGRDPLTGQAISQKMTLRPVVGLGLPAKRERDLYYLVLAPWIERHGFGSNRRIGPIGYREACVELGLTPSGRTYREIHDSLKTLAMLNVEFENCIVHGQTRKISGFVDKWFSFHYFNEGKARHAKESGRPYELKAGQFYLEAADWFVQSYKSNYIKPFDHGVYKVLRTPLAKALYSYLDKRAWESRRKRYRPEVRENIKDLKERFRLGVRADHHLNEEFRRAHKDLLEKWPALQGADVHRVRRGHYELVYSFGLQTSPETRANSTETPKLVPQNGATALVTELTRRGVIASVAAHLADRFPDSRIKRHIDVHDQEARLTLLQNPGGRLRQRIEEDWQPFEGYIPPEERKIRKDRLAIDEHDRRLEHEKDERRRTEFDALPLEQKVEKHLDRWRSMGSAYKNHISQEQEQQKRAELYKYYSRNNAS